MRKEIACVILILLAACVNKPGQPVQEATSTAVIGGADSMTSIVVADTCASFQDTVTYELRQCQLWYTKDLPEAYNGETRLWTEYEVYTENVPVINVFVSNPTDIPLEFGRDMRFYLWKNDKWCPPEQRDTSYTIVWNSDAFMIKKAPLLYCFRYKLNEYCIPKALVYTERELTSWGERMQMLKDLGMNPVERERIDHPTTENIQLEIDKFTEKVTSKKNPFPVDGLVICYDDTAYAATGSVTGHHATRAGFAFKWQDEHADTVLDHIEWSCAASTITPVAVFKPIELEGTTVQRASLCNVSECERLGIGDKGTRLQVIKANKIIPKVINITEVVGSFVIPAECPVCHAPAVVRESESGTKTLHCTNAACPAKQLKKFARFVSKEGINIDGISEQTVWKFINHGFIREYADFYKLKNYAFEISCFEGFGKKSVSNLLESVEKSRHTDGRHLLYALNIPLCGGDVAKKLLSRYKVKELIETARLSMFDDEFASIDGIGPEKSAKFIAWFKDDIHFQHVQHLLSELIIEEQESVETGNKCQGLTFVVTGDVHHYKNRNELKAYIESQGGKVTGSVSKSTNFLINNDAASQSSKNKKAHELNIPIITEDEFIEKFQE